MSLRAGGGATETEQGRVRDVEVVIRVLLEGLGFAGIVGCLSEVARLLRFRMAAKVVALEVLLDDPGIGAVVDNRIGGT